MHQLDLSKQYNNAPFFCYEKLNRIKFRKYNISDDYHACKEDFKFQGSNYQCTCDSSEFRNIDKARLIYRAIDKTINLASLRKYHLFDNIYVIRNFEAYKSLFTFEYISL